MTYKNKNTNNRRRYKSRYKNPHNYKTKRTSAQNRAAVFAAVATFLVIASVVVIIAFGDNIYGFISNAIGSRATKGEITVASVAEMTNGATKAPTEKTKETVAETTAPTEKSEQSAEFIKLLEKASLNEDKLSGSQMMFVETDGSSCTLYCYEKNSDGVWKNKFDTISGYIGEGGTSENISPYDNTTPVGTFNIEFAFGTNSDPGTKLEYNSVDYSSYWVTDPSSVNYNRLVDGSVSRDFESAQWLYEYTVSYPYAVVFDYNRNPVDKSKGCAKFLHVSSSATQGGIGISQTDLTRILQWLDPAASPTISIY